MSIYVAISAKLSVALMRAGVVLDFRLHGRAAIVTGYVDGVSQDISSWDSPDSALIMEQVLVVPPHSRGKYKLLGGPND